MDLTLEEIEKIEKALGEATPGPWEYEQNGKRGAWIGNNGYWAALSCGSTDEEATANAHLIANAPEWLRQLVEQNKGLLARNEELHRLIEKMEQAIRTIKVFADDILHGELQPENVVDIYDKAIEALDAKEQDDAASD